MFSKRVHLAGAPALAVFLAFGATTSSQEPATAKSEKDLTATISNPPPREFAPMTRYERLGNYVAGLVSYESVFTAAATGGISQATNTPKEWGGGAEAYGERVGNIF